MRSAEIRPELAFMKVLLLATVLAASPRVETITYHVLPCRGACPVYSVTVSSDGQAIFNGENYVAVKGERSFRITPLEFNAFRARLAPYRPEAGQEVLVQPDTALCPKYITDSPSIEIAWSSDGNRSGHLFYYSGCINPKVPHGMRGSLAQAINTLPILEFIGSMDRR
jgi:hypothetical protein